MFYVNDINLFFHRFNKITAGIIKAKLTLLHLDSFSLKNIVLAIVTTRIAPTLYVGYAMYALTLDSDFRSRRDDK